MYIKRLEYKSYISTYPLAKKKKKSQSNIRPMKIEILGILAIYGWDKRVHGNKQTKDEILNSNSKRTYRIGGGEGREMS